MSHYQEQEELNDDRMTVERKKEPKRPSYFPSNSQGNFIKNAITGVEYTWRVGTNDARRLFRVIDTTGLYDPNGRRLRRDAVNFPNPQPNHCYYESPEQYMRHRKATISQELINRWERAQQEFKVQEEL